MLGRTKRASACLVISTVLSGCGTSSGSPITPDPAGAAKPRRIVVLGDSLGVSPSADESFPAVLRPRVASSAMAITNASRGGETTGGGLARLKPLLDADVTVLVVALADCWPLRPEPATRRPMTFHRAEASVSRSRFQER